MPEKGVSDYTKVRLSHLHPHLAVWVFIRGPLSSLSLWQKEMTSRMCH